MTRRRKRRGRRTSIAEDAVDDARRAARGRRGSRGARPLPASASRLRYEFCIGPSMRPANEHAEQVGEPEVLAPAPPVSSKSEVANVASTLPPRGDVRADRRALRVATAPRRRRGSSSLNGVEPLGRQQRLVHQLERHARLDERVIHPEHVIVGTIAVGDASVIRGGLLGVEQRDARQRRLVAQVALVVEVPLVDALDDGQPAPIVEHARELRDPRPHAVGRAFRDPEPHLRLALHRVLPAVRLLDADAEDAADGLRPHDRAVFLRAPAVRPRRRQAASRLVVRELDVGEIAGGLHVGRAVRDEPRARDSRRAPWRPSASTARSAAPCAIRGTRGVPGRAGRSCAAARGRSRRRKFSRQCTQ